MHQNAGNALTANLSLIFSVYDSPSIFCLCLFKIALTELKTTVVWPQIIFSTKCLTVRLGAPQIRDCLASLHSYQHWSLLKIAKMSSMSSILHWYFLDPRAPNISEHFHIFQFVSWSVADIPRSGVACYSPGILLLVFPRVWCWLHVSHAELQVWCKCELNIQMHFSSGAYHSQVALFHSSLTSCASMPAYITSEFVGVQYNALAITYLVNYIYIKMLA